MGSYFDQRPSLLLKSGIPLSTEYPGAGESDCIPAFEKQFGESSDIFPYSTKIIEFFEFKRRVMVVLPAKLVKAFNRTANRAKNDQTCRLIVMVRFR